MRTRISRSDAGFTLIELLVTLALSSVIAVMVFEGVSGSRRAWEKSAALAETQEIDVISARLRDLVAKSTAKFVSDPQTKSVSLMFKGSETGLSFVTLSEANEFRGGLMQVRLSLVPDEREGTSSLIAETAVFYPDPARAVNEPPVTLFKNVQGLNIRYYGKNEEASEAQWSTVWRSRNRLPMLVEFTLKIKDRPASVQELRVPVALQNYRPI